MRLRLRAWTSPNLLRTVASSVSLGSSGRSLRSTIDSAQNAPKEHAPNRNGEEYRSARMEQADAGRRSALTVQRLSDWTFDRTQEVGRDQAKPGTELVRDVLHCCDEPLRAVQPHTDHDGHHAREPGDGVAA